MKHRNHWQRIPKTLLAIAVTAGVAQAGTTETMMTPAPAPAPADDVISGTLTLDINTHFISYGLDVWSDDNPQINELNFNPMLELAFALPNDFTFTLGSWADVNDKGNGGSLGGDLREVDIWAGLSYTYEKFTVGVTAQNWLYGSASEEILDVKFSYDCLLSPSLTIHNRLGAGASGGDEGTILVLGLSHSVEAGPVTVSFPFNVAYFATDEFHGAGNDDGFGYCSIGVGASLPLTPYIGGSFGEWDLHGGLTYYFTDDDIISNNDHNDFLTASLGLGLSF
ncbi:MAG: hypothetical protein KDN05_22605 [Verrucomicrobiae bacterium]|nr:hypothetical protein [Verrucomicrobiae bacterium]